MHSNRRTFLGSALAGATGLGKSDAAPTCEIGAYYFPNYHVDPRNEARHGKGWTEWELVKRAGPRFPGHAQPKRPLWGFQDESDPKVFERKVDVASSHGITHFIWDWYWYAGRPFLNRALENGYLRCANRERLRFCLMWANHDWFDIQPAKLHNQPELQFPGGVARGEFDRLTDYVIERYFSQPGYWTVRGCPCFSIYETFTLVKGLGGVTAARDALERFREKTRAAGFPGLHLNAILWGLKTSPGEAAVRTPRDLVAALGIDSTTSYCWAHHVKFPSFPETDYSGVARAAAALWTRPAEELGVPYYPNVSMGWDATPRTCQSDVFTAAPYPFTPVLRGNTPAAFRHALEAARRHLDSSPARTKVLTLNAWNEWTEGSYLEPDSVNGMAYLEAVRDVFRS